MDGVVYAKQRLPYPPKRHLGILRRFLVSDQRGLFGVYRDNNMVKPGYFFQVATALKPQQITMSLHISARVCGHC